MFSISGILFFSTLSTTHAITALPLPYFIYIVLVHRPSGFCYDQIKDFVDPIKEALNIFYWKSKDQLLGKSIFAYAPESNGTKDYEMLLKEITRN